MLNLKQEKLIRQFIEEIRKRFPEVRLINVTPSAEDPNDLWIHVTAPEDEECEFELTEFCADRTTDILLDYGYHMLVLPVGKPEDAAAWSASDPIPYTE